MNQKELQMQKEGLDNNWNRTNRLSDLYNPAASARRFLAKREADTERELDDLIRSGRTVDAEILKRLGKRITDMCATTVSERYLRICTKYLRISNEQLEAHKRIQSIVEYEENYGSR